MFMHLVVPLLKAPLEYLCKPDYPCDACCALQIWPFVQKPEHGWLHLISDLELELNVVKLNFITVEMIKS